MLLVIDNYDSFTYNLVQYLGELGADVTVRRNDAITVDGVQDLGPDRIVISPGPGRPEDAGVTVDVIRRYGARFRFWVCASDTKRSATPSVRPLRPHRCCGTARALMSDTTDVACFGDWPPTPRRRYHSLVVASGAMASRARGLRPDRRWHDDHGSAPSHATRSRCAVSSGEHP